MRNTRNPYDILAKFRYNVRVLSNKGKVVKKGTSYFWSPLFLGLITLFSFPVNTRANSTDSHPTIQLFVRCQQALRRQRMIQQIAQIVKIRSYCVKSKRIQPEQPAFHFRPFLSVAPIRAGPVVA